MSTLSGMGIIATGCDRGRFFEEHLEVLRRIAHKICLYEPSIFIVLDCAKFSSAKKQVVES